MSNMLDFPSTLEARLAFVEGLLMFVAQSMRIRVNRASGVLDAAGNPTTQTSEGTLLDFYLAEQTQKQRSVGEKSNGPTIIS